jgi:Nuclease-related domain
VPSQSQWFLVVAKSQLPAPNVDVQMQIKGLDDIQSDIDALNELAARPDVDVAMRQRIELRLRFLKAGAKAERDAEYEIEFYARNRADVVTIHGLRIECEGRTAAIDHMIMNRRLQIWLCESKSVSEAVHITEDGEWWRSYRGERQEMTSPIEQNHHHVEVLEGVFSNGLVSLKTSIERLRPRIKTLVVISKSGRIVRPPVGSAVEGLDTVIRCDLLMSKIKRANEESIAQPVVSIEHVVSAEALRGLAKQLVSLHAPPKRDWAARFGLPAEPPPTLFAADSAGATDATSRDPTEGTVVSIGSPRFVCADCRSSVSVGVANYCRDRASQFGSRILCLTCQSLLSARGTPRVGAERAR